jgi:hypothetical protein
MENCSENHMTEAHALTQAGRLLTRSGSVFIVMGVPPHDD